MPARHQGQKPDTRPCRRYRCKGSGGFHKGRPVGDCPSCGATALSNGTSAAKIWAWCPRCGTSFHFEVKQEAPT